ncbi:MAG TPA: threonine ammonia-lyase, biosynthetic [Nevskiaceae bacterium]|nr:threonine ammonia-lyase, biosynthetic [Nevskiaceae bacterium]
MMSGHADSARVAAMIRERSVRRAGADTSDAERRNRIRLLADYRARIDAAHVYDVAVVSPLQDAPMLSARLGDHVLLKREDMQSVHSFKLRGAYNKIAALSIKARARGVVAASAGNHAQGVALAAQRMGIEAWIVMPRTTPAIKVEAVRALGAHVVLHGDAYDDAAAQAASLVVEKGLTPVPPYDDPDVIAGQGTVGKEIVEQIAAARFDAVFVPVGGGGLLAGVAAYIKSARPGTLVIGVEPNDSNCMAAALAAGRRVQLPEVGLFADGVAVRQAGKETYRVARACVDGVVTVSVDEICSAVRDLYTAQRAIAEPAGALGIAGLKRWVQAHPGHGRTLVAVVSGANVNFDRLRHIAERAELGDGKETLLAATIPECPGSFRAFLKLLGRRVVTEFNYRYAGGEEAHVFAGVQFADAEDRAKVLAGLHEQGIPVVDLSGNEMAKAHVRYMVGGHGHGVTDERLFRFEFPERPGALGDFLRAVGAHWNISLFHYRNHGAAYGRVLCGLQVPRAEREDCRRALDGLGYAWADETANPAYSLFLAA